MRNLILLFTLLLFSSNLLCQDITYFFQNLPDSCLLNLSKQERKKIANNHSDELVMIGYNSFMFKKVDDKFGYLIGSFDGCVNLKIWELSNGEKLIAVHKSNGTIGICYREFHFYKYNGKGYELLNNLDVLPLEDIEQGFFKGNYEDNINRIHEDFNFSCLIESISPEGFNISVNYYLVGDTANYEKYGVIGDKMELIWNDGKFIKGKVYWSDEK